MPFVSSHHLRLFPWLLWQRNGLRPPVLSFEAWIEDMSQNGTYVNKVLLGRGISIRLTDGDIIDAVSNRSRGYYIPDPLIEPIPSFVYRASTSVAAVATVGAAGGGLQGVP